MKNINPRADLLQCSDLAPQAGRHWIEGPSVAVLKGELQDATCCFTAEKYDCFEYYAMLSGSSDGS